MGLFWEVPICLGWYILVSGLYQKGSGVMKSESYYCPFCGGHEINLIAFETPKHKLIPDHGKIEVACPIQKKCVIKYLLQRIN
jgi:hypothetical protein